jgi:hypothetical protein
VIYQLFKNYKVKDVNMENVYVYSMGKVGSMSIYSTLLSNNIKSLHFHYLNGDFNTNGISIGERIGLKKLNGKIKIISLVRDPVARNISAYFQNLKIYLGKEKNFQTTKFLERIFFSKYPHLVPITWFDNEFKKSTGIDIYNYEFDKILGFNIIEINEAMILILKTETDDVVKKHAIELFLGMNLKSEIGNENESNNKEYSEIYNDFKSSIDIPIDYINKLYDSKYMKHFYSNYEIHNLKKKWEKSGK